MSVRQLLLLVMALYPPGAPATPVTARQVVEQIRQHLGVALPPSTVDTFKAGNPDTPVTGIAVTMMATFDVLERAAARGDNFVITHEPTFYNHRDQTADLEKQEDAVLAQKQDFIAQHHLVVWRFHDGWHARHPDGILLGMTKALGWEKFQDPAHPSEFAIPATNLNALAWDIQRKLQSKVLRVVGKPDLSVQHVALLPGAAGSARQIQLLERPEVEVLIIGETPEWETVEYVSDAVSQGRPKALLILGHIQSEQAGMEECVRWLSGFMKGCRIDFVAAREPFWLPTAQAQR